MIDKLISKIGTPSAYILAFLTWDSITKLLAIILTICMIVFYVMKNINEYLTNKKLRNELRNNERPERTSGQG